MQLWVTGGKGTIGRAITYGYFDGQGSNDRDGWWVSAVWGALGGMLPENHRGQVHLGRTLDGFCKRGSLTKAIRAADGTVK